MTMVYHKTLFYLLGFRAEKGLYRREFKSFREGAL